MDIQQSLDVILRSSEVVGEGFYETFFERHPDARPFFQDVNMSRQVILLTM